METLPCPRLGEKDKTNQIAFQKNVADTIPGTSIIYMNDEGHAVAMENPNKVLSAIVTFLRETI